MPAKRHRVFIYVGLLLAFNWLFLASVDPDAPSSDVIRLGTFLGSLFAQTTLASAWTAFGPGPFIWRAPLSFVWVITLPVAIGINVAIHDGPKDATVLVGSCLLGQWLVLQLPLWTLALVLRLRLRHINEIREEAERFQFGIRHLLIVMALASTALGSGRYFALRVSPQGEERIFAFLAAVAIVLTLPLLLAALMRRMAIPGVLLALAMSGVATALELPLAEMVGATGPEKGHFVAINAVSAILILAVAGPIRMNGYILCAQPAADSASTD